MFTQFCPSGKLLEMHTVAPKRQSIWTLLYLINVHKIYRNLLDLNISHLQSFLKISKILIALHKVTFFLKCILNSHHSVGGTLAHIVQNYQSLNHMLFSGFLIFTAIAVFISPRVVLVYIILEVWAGLSQCETRLEVLLQSPTQ